MIINLDAATPQLELVKNFIQGYMTLDTKNVEPFISKSYTYQSFPKIHYHPDEEKEPHFDRYGSILSLLTKFETTVHEVIEAPGKVVLHVTTVNHTFDGTELDYDCVVIITVIEENGELKVDNFKDFADPEKRDRLFGWIANAVAKEAPKP